MKRVAWLTDIHLNFLSARQVDEFLKSVAALQCDAVLVGGDIGEAIDVCDFLDRMDELIPVPIYFVLGNHDYYHGSIVEVRQRVARFCAERPRLHFLTMSSVEQLTTYVGLVGHDGWADGRLGDYLGSMVSMQDFRLIAELSSLSKLARWNVLKALGDEAAAHIRQVLPDALARFDQMLLVTHVPPLGEACWHEGQLSNAEWSPHFTCHAMGQAILEIMAEHPAKRLTVLCGHTHGSGEAQPLANVQIITGGAEYGHPTVQRIFEFE